MIRPRDPEATRAQLLKAAFAEIYAHGYATASVDRIVEESGVTKGALYHHFGSKKGLAEAMIDSMIGGMVVDSFLGPLGEASDPIDGIQRCISAKVDELTPETVSCGCPLNNLAQELAGSDDDFQAQIDALYERWRLGLTEALARGQESHLVRDDVDVGDVAMFVVAAMTGIAGFAKSSRSVGVAGTCAGVLSSYLDSLRAPPYRTEPPSDSRARHPNRHDAGWVRPTGADPLKGT